MCIHFVSVCAVNEFVCAYYCLQLTVLKNSQGILQQGNTDTVESQYHVLTLFLLSLSLHSFNSSSFLPIVFPFSPLSLPSSPFSPLLSLLLHFCHFPYLCSRSQHEERRVATLENRLSELSETVGNYDRQREGDQQAIL